MEFEKVYRGICLAGLFHDIGKFWQRATKGDEELSSETLKLQDELCPERGKYRYVLWTSEFFEKFGTYFPINVSEIIGSDTLDNVKNLSARHHKPSSPLQIIIQQADWLSSGMDRTKAEGDIKDEFKGEFRKRRLKSIFSSIGNKNSDDAWAYHLTPLEPDEKIFPFKEEKELTEEEAIKEYKNFGIHSLMSLNRLTFQRGTSTSGLVLRFPSLKNILGAFRARRKMFPMFLFTTISKRHPPSLLLCLNTTMKPGHLETLQK